VDGSYQPFPIYDMKAGMVTAKKPWLIPKDAFTKLINAYLYQGVLQKRKGYTEFGKIVHGESTYPGYPVMGIFSWYDSIGGSALLAFDTKRWNKYNTVSKEFEDPVGSDTFSGGDDQFFWTENWKDQMFVTNNKDRVKTYDGADMTNLMMDIDGDESNDIDCCLLLFAHKDRLIALRTTENATVCLQRARWCKAGYPDNWKEADGGGYADAPTIDAIMGAEFIGDDLIVWFERSVWILKYTGNPNAPFRWQRISTTEGCYATYSVLPFSDELLAVGPTGLLGTDTFDVYSIDQKIPDLLLEANPEKIKYVYGAVIEELRQNWWLYPSANASLSDRTLVLDYTENSWATYNLVMHCLGYYHFEEDLTWDDIEETWDELEMSWDERSKMAGYPITLGGGQDGVIYHMDDGGSDNGGPIDFEVEGGRWNPYAEKGMKAKLGYIDFFVDKDSGIDIDIDLYIDQMISPYKVKTLNCGSDVDQEKVWKRVYVGTVGNFHRIRLYHSAIAQTPKVHAIVPYFKPTGRMI